MSFCADWIHFSFETTHYMNAKPITRGASLDSCETKAELLNPTCLNVIWWFELAEWRYDQSLQPTRSEYVISHFSVGAAPVGSTLTATDS